MQEACKALDFGNSTIQILSIIGSPGFGKSTLAIHVAHEQRSHVFVHYENLADYPKTKDEMELYNSVFERLFEMVGTTCKGYNTLVILDNCDDVIHNRLKEFQHDVEKLAQSSKSIKIMLTSRQFETISFDLNTVTIKINNLTDTAAHKLIEAKIELTSKNISITKEQVMEIARLTGNVPLALQIIGSLLCLEVGAPTPSTVIKQLQDSPMKILAPRNFPKSMFESINISYGYLPKEVQKLSRQLSIFPGSFELGAAIDVCGTDSSTLLSILVSSSLLECFEQTKRYQYHSLIRQYFLDVANNADEAERSEVRSSFQIHYAIGLISASQKFNEQYDKSSGSKFTNSELHNIQELFQPLSTLDATYVLPENEFLITAIALSIGIDANLLNLRYWCGRLNISLTRFQDVIKTYENLTEISFKNTSFTKQDILSYYLIIIDQVADCEWSKNSSSDGYIKVYIAHRTTVHERESDVEQSQYVKFFEKLRDYYSQQGDNESALECHKFITQLLGANDTQRLYDKGLISYNAKDYHKSAEILKQALSNYSNKEGILIKMKAPSVQNARPQVDNVTA